MLTIDIAQPLPTLAAVDPRSGRSYQWSHVLVRLHTKPLGFVDLPLNADGVSPDACATAIWQALQGEINAALASEGQPPISSLDGAGIVGADMFPSVAKRRQFLKDAPSASIVLCTRDRIDFLMVHLPHLLTLNYPDYEIIVVDNASRTSAVADLITKHYSHLPQVRYIREERPGLSWARNCALAHARGEIIAFADDDEWADTDWLLELAYAFQCSDQVDCVTGAVMAAELETPSQFWLEQFGGFYKGRGIQPALFNLTTHRQHQPLYPYLASIFGAGANMAFKTAVLRELGGFDPALGAGTLAPAAEDIEIFFRLINQGYTLAYEPSALLHHYHRRDYAALKRQLSAYGIGFTAYLTRIILEDPKHLGSMLRQTPYALRYLFGSQSPRNQHKQPTFPGELTRIELFGMLYGPLAYLRSRHRAGQIARSGRG
jgi:glycosyltransferase involved in cell wall biosynthesis